VRNARGEIVFFIDDDAVADENWLENLVKNYEDTNVVGVGGLIKPLWEDGYPTWFPEELNWVVGCSYKGLPEFKASVRNPIGCNMSFRKTVFEKVGYFRSDIGRFGKKLLASEETELSMRVLGKIQNAKIIYDPSAIVHHKVNKHRGSLKYVWVRSFYEGLSKAIVSKESIRSKLSTEVGYLKYLLSVAIPWRCRRIYKFEELSKLLTLLLSLSAVITGFVKGKTLRGE
jgi:GT2 family glycosyltransferase